MARNSIRRIWVAAKFGLARLGSGRRDLKYLDSEYVPHRFYSRKRPKFVEVEVKRFTHVSRGKKYPWASKRQLARYAAAAQ